MKKLLIYLVVVFVLLCGCSDEQIATPDNTTPLSVMIYDRGDVPEGAGTITDNVMTRWVADNFGKPNNIDISYVAVPRNDNEVIKVLMASGNVPDLIFSYGFGTMHNFYLMGNLLDITDYVASSEKIREFVGEDILSVSKFDGRQVVIPARRLISGRQAQLVRKDWLDKLGLGVPSNTDEFYNMLCQFKKYDPGNNGEKNIPYGISGNVANFSDLMRSFMKIDFTDETEMNCGEMYGNSGYKEGVRFMNKLYNEGLLSPDFEYDYERKKVESDIARGYVGFFCDDLGRPLMVDGVYDRLKENVPGAELVALDTWTTAEGDKYKCVYDNTALYMGISSVCAYPENVIKYLEWMADVDVLRTLQYGFEGVTYEYNENGIPVTIDSEESKITHWYNLGFDLALIVNGKYSENEDELLDYNAWATIDPDLYKECYRNSITDGWVKRNFSIGNDEVRLNNSVKREALDKVFNIECITCSPVEFDRLYDSALEQLNQIGHQYLIERNREDYIARYNK